MRAPRLEKRVRHAPRRALPDLQAAAEKRNAHIGHNREVCRSALSLRIVVRHGRVQRGLREDAASYVMEECAVDVRY